MIIDRNISKNPHLVKLTAGNPYDVRHFPFIAFPSIFVYHFCRISVVSPRNGRVMSLKTSPVAHASEASVHRRRNIGTRQVFADRRP